MRREMATDPDPARIDELMDSVYRRQRHFYDLTRKHFLLGRDTLISRLHPPAGGTVLEIGCGTGRNLIAAARAYGDARLYGLDVSSAMLATARAKIRRAGLEGRITLALGDAGGFDASGLFGQARFDRVFFSYCLSMIPPWREAVRNALDLVEHKGGRVLIVDFGGQRQLPDWFKRALFSWLEKFHVAPRLELAAALAALAEESGGRLVLRSIYRDYAQIAEIRR
jgi:S-adenosylmethionine-diacylgycerolhomoserine-N-methlytransferase